MQEVLSDSGEGHHRLIYLADYIKCTFPLVSVFAFRVDLFIHLRAVFHTHVGMLGGNRFWQG